MAARQVYGKLLDRLGTESVFVVVGYFKHALNAAAHDQGIHVHEFQHAAISPYSLGYSYPGRPHVPYSPDTLLCFGPFWTSAPDPPANTKPVVVGRTGALDALLARAPPKRSRQVVVISQGVIGVELLQLAVRAARLAPDYRFVFRRHPGEIEADLRASLSRAGLECPANLAIVGSDPPFYDSLAESEVQVGVFSTGLFEGCSWAAARSWPTCRAAKPWKPWSVAATPWSWARPKIWSRRSRRHRRRAPTTTMPSPRTAYGNCSLATATSEASSGTVRTTRQLA